MLKLQDMPGPSDEARALQLKQWDLRSAFYQVLNDAYRRLGPDNRDAVYKDPVVVTARETYDATVPELEALLGPDAHCASVDADLWSDFSDFYKDETGFRPRHHLTRAQVQDWLKLHLEAPAPL